MGLNKKRKQQILTKIKQDNFSEDLGKTECIICKKENVSVCSYCFFLKTTKTLRKLNLGGQFIQYFLATFSYYERNETH